MPALVTDMSLLRKRKQEDGDNSGQDAKPRKAARSNRTKSTSQERILLLEEEILHGREHYNNIVELLKYVPQYDSKPKTATLASVSLCRVFCRFIASEALVKRNGSSKDEVQILQWLKERMKDYVGTLCNWIGSLDPAKESAALTLLMKIVKAETSQAWKRSEQAWRDSNAVFFQLLSALLEKTNAAGARQEFVEKYVEEYDDVRFFTFQAVRQITANPYLDQVPVIGNAIDLLTQVEGVPESEEQLEDWYGGAPPTGHKQLRSLNAHRKVAQEAWLAIFRAPLIADYRKRVIGVATTHLLPWFANRAELLTDFLTDSFNEGGALSLLALNSIFYLMTEKNIDYPDFYTKLYSLLDDNILHSKYRSRFLRLFDTFMGSSHLPAAMVASFIKRLARLSLQAPPGAIVWIVPWVYNMMKLHPTCLFMLHRERHPAHAIWASAKASEDGEEVLTDPFNAEEPDPNLTNAIESSLWELEMLQSHYHPNVATLAKILAQPFTKDRYTLEDFLDHSYGSLIDAELRKEMKKEPVVEWEIPKRIVSEEGGGLNRLGKLLQTALQHSPLQDT